MVFPLHRLVPGVLCIAACVAAFDAAAQAAASGRRPDPLDARAAVPGVAYDSALSRSRRATFEERSIPWREANDTAARIGGWRAYAREAQQAEPAPAGSPGPQAPQAPQSDKARPAPSGHGGHKTP